jgi:glycosidase
MKLLLSSTISLAILSVATSTSTEESEFVTTDADRRNSRRSDYNHWRRHNKNKWWDDDAAEGTVGAKDNKGALADTLKHYFMTLSKEDGSEVSSLSALMCY